MVCLPTLQARNAALRREKELMARHYAQLKAALDRGRAAAAERLKQLSVMSGTAMQVCGRHWCPVMHCCAVSRAVAAGRV
jgi:hypothetical protein